MKFSKLKRTFIIAEISANHGQDFNKAVTLIKEAKKSGVDAVKFQAYTPETMTIDVDNKYFKIKHPEWGGQTLYQLYKKAYTPWEWFKELKKITDDIGLIFLCTAFDKTSVDMLESLNIVAHKIASFELVDLPLIEYMTKTKKPIILSTGMGSIPEISDAISSIKKIGENEIILLKCVSSYPAKYEEMNLRTIPDMKKIFNCLVGISDHSLGIDVSVAAVCLGACIVEKHFTLSRNDKTPDSFFSIEPDELKILVDKIRLTEKALGKIRYGLTPDQAKNKSFRRSLFAIKDIKKGEIFSAQNIKSIRPGDGILPKYYKEIIGKKALCTIKRGSPIKFSFYKDN